MGTATTEEEETAEDEVAGAETEAGGHGPEGPAHPWFARLYDRVMRRSEAELFPPHREYLARDLQGDVLDLGAGTGAMLPYYEEPVRSGAARVTILEPDPYMREQAVAAARDRDLNVMVSDATAESLPFADDSFDVVVASMVFCTIADPGTALDEVARVLRPGGEFRFLEHVAEDGWRRIPQRLLAPLWSRVAAGCRLTRRTGDLFSDHDAFAVVDIEYRQLGVFPVRPFVRGTLSLQDVHTGPGADPSVRQRVRKAVAAARSRLER